MAFSNSDILILAKAGFTAQQIAALNSTQQAPAVAPAAQTAPAAPAAAPAAQTTPAAPDMFQQIMDQLKMNAINSTQQPAAQTVDDILAEVINPPAVESK